MGLNELILLKLYLKKKMWNIIDETRLELTTTIQTKKKDKNNAIVLKIIK